MKLTEKEFKDYLKLTFSSLFARRMPIVVFGCPGTHDQQFFASNIPLIDMELYEPKTLYYIHKVILKHEDFVNDLFELFPILKTSVVLMDTRPFMAFLNKQKTYEGIELIKNQENELYLTATIGDSPVIKSPIVGTLISEHQAFMYRDLFDSGVVTSEEPFVCDIIDETFTHDDICPVPTITVYNKSFNTCRELLKGKVPVQEGMSFVALKEFMKNSKTTGDFLTCTSGAINKAAKVSFRFVSDFVIVESVQPAARWYCN